jgi:hypothetical protein
MLYATLYPLSDTDVEQFLYRFCKDYSYYVDLKNCQVELNGEKYDIVKGAKVGDLPDAPGRKFPSFVVYAA